MGEVELGCNEEPWWEEGCGNLGSGVAETSVSLWGVLSSARNGFLDGATRCSGPSGLWVPKPLEKKGHAVNATKVLVSKSRV